LPKLKKDEKSLFIRFTRPEDLALYERLVRDAEQKRYPVQVYALLVLLEAYRDEEAPQASGL
jgi:hypothetical protein